MVYTLLNYIYHAILLFLLVALGLNTVELGHPRKQVMSAFVMLPLLLRLLNIK